MPTRFIAHRPRVRRPLGALEALGVSGVLGLVFVSGCKVPDPWAACRTAGPVGFEASASNCTSPACAQCAQSLDEAWHDRREPGHTAVFRLQFMRAAANAREAFCKKNNPDGSYAYEHCTAGLAPGARCAAYGSHCIALFSRALRSGETTLSQRVQLDLAASQACPSARDALVEDLTRCGRIPDGPCTSAVCRDCVAGTIAAASVLAPRSTDPDVAPSFRATVDSTPEPVARALIEALGGPEPPADVDPVVVARSARAWCLSLLERSRQSPPFTCFRVVGQTLNSPRATDFTRAWNITKDTNPEVRASLLGSFMREAAAAERVDAVMSPHLRALPLGEVSTAATRVMALSSTTNTGYSALRGMLVELGVSGAALPPEQRRPVNQENQDTPRPSPEETTEPHGGGGLRVHPPGAMGSRAG